MSLCEADVQTEVRSQAENCNDSDHHMPTHCKQQASIGLGKRQIGAV